MLDSSITEIILVFVQIDMLSATKATKINVDAICLPNLTESYLDQKAKIIPVDFSFKHWVCKVFFSPLLVFIFVGSNLSENDARLPQKVELQYIWTWVSLEKLGCVARDFVSSGDFQAYCQDQMWWHGLRNFLVWGSSKLVMLKSLI